MKLFRNRHPGNEGLLLASNQLTEAMFGTTNEIRRYLVKPLRKLCNSRTISRCSTCTTTVLKMTDVLVRLLSEGNCYLLEQTESRPSFSEILKDIKQGYRGHKSLMSRLGLRPFKHDESAEDDFMKRLREADSTPVPRGSPERAPPEWPNIVRVLCYGAGAIIDGFPPVSSLSVIPKAVAAAMTAFEKYHQNIEARKDLRQWIKDIEAAGDFTHLQRPMDLFQQTAKTMESRPHFKRLVHATSDEQLLSVAERKIDRALMLEILDRTSQALQSIHTTSKDVALMHKIPDQTSPDHRAKSERPPLDNHGLLLEIISKSLQWVQTLNSDIFSSWISTALRSFRSSKASVARSFYLTRRGFCMGHLPGCLTAFFVK